VGLDRIYPHTNFYVDVRLVLVDCFCDIF